MSETHHNSFDLRVQIIEGDCIAQMKLLPDASIDMVLADLPYGTTRNVWDSQIDLDLFWKAVRRVTRAGAAVVLSSQGPFTARLILSNELEFRYKIVWVKSKPTNFLNVGKQPLRRHEDLCVFYRKPPTYNPQMSDGDPYDKGVRKDQTTGSYGEFKPVRVKSKGGRFPTDVLYFKTAESEGQVWHPTQKPVALFEYLIRTYTDVDEVVLDCTAGSGTTGKAAVAAGRRAILIDNDPECVAIMRERLSKAGETLDAFLGTQLEPDLDPSWAEPPEERPAE